MKRSRRITTLIAILIISCLATFILTKYEAKQEEISASEQVVLEIPPDDVTSISWNCDGESLAFHINAGKWFYDDDEAFPVSTNKITEILSHFEEFGVNFIIENVKDFDQYGLADPECSISLAAEDNSYTIKLGSYSQMDSQRYIDIGDGNVYLVNDDPLEYLETDLSALIANDTVPDLDTITNIQFSGAEDYQINYKEDCDASYSDEDVYFVENGKEYLPLDTSKVTNYLDTISALTLDNYATYNATDSELESYGLDKPELTISIDYTYLNDDEDETNDTFVLHISSNPEEQEAYEKAKASGKEEDELPTVSKYVRFGDSQIVYLLTDSAYETLSAAAYNDLRHSQIFWADFDDITQIDITLEDETHTLSMTPAKKDGEDADWYYNDKEIDIASFKSALTGLTSDSFTEKETKDCKEEIALTLHLDNEDFPQVEIQLFRYDGTNCLAVVDDKSISFIERSLVMDLVESAQTIILD